MSVKIFEIYLMRQTDRKTEIGPHSETIPDILENAGEIILILHA
jgi:hypothetical protein